MHLPRHRSAPAVLAVLSAVALAAATGCAGQSGHAKAAASAAAPAGPSASVSASAPVPAPRVEDVPAAVAAAKSVEVYWTQRFAESTMTGTRVRVEIGDGGKAEIERTFTRDAIEMAGGNPDEALSMIRVRDVDGMYYMQGQAMDPDAKSDWPKPWMRFDPARSDAAGSLPKLLGEDLGIPADVLWPILLLAESPDTEADTPFRTETDDSFRFSGTVTASDLAAHDPADFGWSRETFDRLLKALPAEEFLVVLTTDGRGLPRSLTTQTEARGKDGEIGYLATQVDFTHWNEDLRLTAPTPDETFDVSELG